MEETKSELNKSEPKKPKDQPDNTPKLISSLDLESSARSKRFLKASIGPAVMGLISAALLAGVVALYTWGSTISTDSSNSSNLAVGWAAVLPIAAIILGLVVGIGLPVWWSYKKGVAGVVMVLAFEGLMLLLALLISGFFLFHSASTGTPGVTPPVGCGCNSGAANYCIQCDN